MAGHKALFPHATARTTPKKVKLIDYVEEVRRLRNAATNGPIFIPHVIHEKEELMAMMMPAG
jgi:hypothetical protein